MDSIKDQLKKELQSISFSEERKQEVIHSTKQPRKKKKNWYVWTYRAVLSAAIVLAVSLVLLSRERDIPEMTQAAGGNDFTWMSLLGHDSVKIVLLALAFLLFYSLLKRDLRKKEQSFPECANCGSVWTRSEALYMTFKNQKRNCSHCGVQNYQAKKSRKKTALFSSLIPFMILVSNVMQDSFFGIVVYLTFVALFAIALMPYYVTLQLEDPTKEPLW